MLKDGRLTLSTPLFDFLVDVQSAKFEPGIVCYLAGAICRNEDLGKTARGLAARTTKLRLSAYIPCLFYCSNKQTLDQPLCP